MPLVRPSVFAHREFSAEERVVFHSWRALLEVEEASVIRTASAERNYYFALGLQFAKDRGFFRLETVHTYSDMSASPVRLI